MNSYLKETGFLFTFDAGKRTAGWPESVHKDIDEAWPDVNKAREERVNQKYKYVAIRYIEGLTKHTLPESLIEFGIWDFCFQDSVHDLNSIIEEWEILKPYSKVGSLIVFDDIVRTHPFRDWFFDNESPDWVHRHTSIGRQQLWAERVR